MQVRPVALVALGLLRADARLVPLTHVATLLTELLDVSVLFTPAAAAASRSVRLFDRVYLRITQDATVTPALRDHWLARALQAALENDDLRMAQRIHACHPEPLFVHAPIAPPAVFGSTLGLALRYGSLETVQWVVEHRRDRQCCATGASNLCSGCLLAALPCLGAKDPFRIFCWLLESDVYARLTERNVGRLWSFMVQSVEVVQWLHSRRLLSRRTGELVLTRAVEDGSTEIVAFLLAKGFRIAGEKNVQRKLIHAACFGHAGVVDALLSSGQCSSFQHKLQRIASSEELLVGWHDAAMSDTINCSETVRDVVRTEASRAGNLRMLQWLYFRHGVTPSLWHLQNHPKSEGTLLEIYMWMHHVGIDGGATDRMVAAARHGFLRVVQWLHAHSSAGATARAMDDAAAHGHVDVVNWLHRNRHEGCTKDALTSAAGNGHLRVVQWLLTNRPELRVHADEAKLHAASGGHLDVLVWLCRVREGTCTRCLTQAALHQTPSSAEQQNPPAWLDVLRWVRSLDEFTCDDCAIPSPPSQSSSHVLFAAACSGDLQLVEYLSDFHDCGTRVLSQPRTVRHVALAGHLAVLQWIFHTCGRHSSSESEEQRGGASQWRDAHACGFEHIATWVQSLQV